MEYSTIQTLIRAMSNKYKIVFAIVLITSIGLSTTRIKREHFYRFKFDLDNKELEENLGVFNVEDIMFESLTIGNIKDSLSFSPKEIYEIVFLDSRKEYFFSFEKIHHLKTKIKFENLVWLFRKPLERIGKVEIKRVAIPKNEKKGHLKIAMITDSFGCCLMGGRRMRYYWNEINTEIEFLGLEKDIYQYRYTSFKDLNSKEITDKINYIPNADFYVIWLGRSDSKQDIDKIASNIENLSGQLLSRGETSKVLIMTPPPITDDLLNNRIKDLRDRLVLYNRKNTQIVDVYTYLINQKNWKSKLYFNGYALNDNAYHKIIRLLNHEIIQE